MNIVPTHIGFTKTQIEKIGNTIIYLSKNISELNKTKILKILFLIEEAAIKKTGYPFFGIEFQLWKYGPVSKEIFIDLCEDSPLLFKEYIKRDRSNTEFVAVKEFNDNEFSDYDLELLNNVIAFAKDKTASQLVESSHSPKSLWRKSAIKHGILELLEKSLLNSTDYTIDFSMLFENDAEALSQYEIFKENFEFIRNLKS